jgi:hypothetical protein
MAMVHPRHAGEYRNKHVATAEDIRHRRRSLMPRLFISQHHLDDWIEQKCVQLETDILTLENGGRFRLVPAVFFDKVVGEGADPNQLLGKVKTKGQLAELSAEHYRDSVILGEIAYQVLEGFVGLSVK